MNTSISDLRRTQRQGFTAFELLIVLGIIFVLAAMTMPAIFSALRKGRVSDAANAITYVSTQARQLARARQPLAVGVTAKAYGVAVVAPTPTIPGYVSLTYGGPLPSDAAELMSNGQHVSKFIFNRNVMVYKGADFQSATALSPGTRIVWYFQNQTGLPLQEAGDLEPIGIGTSATPAAYAANGNLITPAVAVSPVCGSLSVRSLDYDASVPVGYAAAIAIYQIGLPNVRNQ